MAACQDDEDYNNQLERYITQLEQLLITIQASRVRVQATLYLQTKKGRRPNQLPLWMRLDKDDDTDNGPLLAESPPAYIPMMCKGVFFDVAGRQLEASTDGLVEQQPAKTFLGLF